MISKPLIVMITVVLGGWLGWGAGSPWGIMTGYFTAVAGASTGLFIGRRIQRNLDDE
ncbi:MAG: hypothetical protein R6V33_11870 [Pelovirga sp.]